MIMISTAMILLIIIGIAVSAQSVKEDFAAGLKVKALGCVIGLLVNVGAGVLYVVNILMGLLNMIMQLFK
jgi:hypothetical protein